MVSPTVAHLHKALGTPGLTRCLSLMRLQFHVLFFFKGSVAGTRHLQLFSLLFHCALAGDMMGVVLGMSVVLRVWATPV